MKKRKMTSWGVSFASLALVGGMISYLGITNKDTTNMVVQSKVALQNSSNVDQHGKSKKSSITNGTPKQSTNNSRTKQAMDESSSQTQQHESFDTTTGGT